MKGVLPLVARMTKAVSGWLGPAYGSGAVLKPDLDQVDGLSAEREAPEYAVGKATGEQRGALRQFLRSVEENEHDADELERAWKRRRSMAATWSPRERRARRHG